MVAPEGVNVADIGVCDAAIVEVRPNLAGSAAHELDAGGLHVLPGGIDAHVHCNEPGRTDWEGFRTASTALACGGMTSYFDMPLNSQPTTVTGAAFDLKLQAARAHSRVDFALWGGLVPGNLDCLGELHERGVIGFKAFMCDSGMLDFPSVDEMTLWEGMKRCAELGAIVAVHAESDSITEALARRARSQGRVGPCDYVGSRPAVAETTAIARAIELAGDTGCPLHIAHVSTARGLELVREAQRRGVDVSAEVASHYLVLVEDDIERLGAPAKCSPPMRDALNRDRLWEYVASDPRAIVTSDHSPSPEDEKTGDDFFAIWGGISGCQTTLPVLLSKCADTAGLEAAVAAVTGHVATRFGLPGKGAIAPGVDADFAIVDLDERWNLTAQELQYRHRHSGLVGVPLRGRVRWTVSRGRTVVADGHPVGEARGQLLTPVVRRGGD